MGAAPSEISLRTALLDTAEALFADSGFDGVSLRELTSRAGANLASVNYHFGSKEKLFEEVIVRRVRPINERRLALLARVLEDAGNTPPALALVLDAFARPFLIGMDKHGRESLRRIAVRLFMESDPLVKPIFERELFPVAHAFLAAMSRACPGLSERQVHFGLVFYVGAMVNLMASEKRREAIMRSSGPVPTDEETLQLLIAFGVAGFQGIAGASTGEASMGEAPPATAKPTN